VLGRLLSRARTQQATTRPADRYGQLLLSDSGCGRRRSAAARERMCERMAERSHVLRLVAAAGGRATATKATKPNSAHAAGPVHSRSHRHAHKVARRRPLSGRLRWREGIAGGRAGACAHVWSLGRSGHPVAFSSVVVAAAARQLSAMCSRACVCLCVCVIHICRCEHTMTTAAQMYHIRCCVPYASREP
jgi:hypothetical protein